MMRRREMTSASCDHPTRVAPYAAYALRRMCQGPYYDPTTQTLRIPHRYRCQRAATDWQKFGFRFDPKRFEYFKDYRQVAEPTIFERTARCRAYYFKFYAAINPKVKPDDAGTHAGVHGLIEDSHA